MMLIGLRRMLTGSRPSASGDHHHHRGDASSKTRSKHSNSAGPRGYGSTDSDGVMMDSTASSVSDSIHITSSNTMTPATDPDNQPERQTAIADASYETVLDASVAPYIGAGAHAHNPADPLKSE